MGHPLGIPMCDRAEGSRHTLGFTVETQRVKAGSHDWSPHPVSFLPEGQAEAGLKILLSIFLVTSPS